MAASSLGPVNFSLREQNFTCFECQENILNTGDICRDRAYHYVRYTSGVHSCPACLLILPTSCAVAAHLRIHLKIPPYICPQCGVTLSVRSISYPFEHSCDGFNMMRANNRLICKFENCNNLFSPNEFRSHFQTHLVKVNQCTICSIIWSTDAQARCQHYQNDEVIKLVGFLCQLCSNNLLTVSNAEEHINIHHDCISVQWKLEIHPCKICRLIYRDVESLINHHIIKHNLKNIKTVLAKILGYQNTGVPHDTDNLWLTRKCNICSTRNTNEIVKFLYTACPNGCSERNELIKCPLCDMKIMQSWAHIKSHCALFHKEYKYLDINLTNIEKNLRAARNIQNDLNEFHSQGYDESVQRAGNWLVCQFCHFASDCKENLETHFIYHRDPNMSYQCLDCGECFSAKGSLYLHLSEEHDIEKVKEYTNAKPCFIESARIKSLYDYFFPSVNIKKNQCTVCEAQFKNAAELEGHARSHGMSYIYSLKRNKLINPDLLRF